MQAIRAALQEELGNREIHDFAEMRKDASGSATFATSHSNTNKLISVIINEFQGFSNAILSSATKLLDSNLCYYDRMMTITIQQISEKSWLQI